MSPKDAANVNLLALGANVYPGRGIILGLDETGKNLVQVYWIMGRSENSRNRLFVSDDDGRLATEFADPSKGGDPKLVIYNAMLERHTFGHGVFVVSNGHQTDAVLESAPSTLVETLCSWKYEPDKPNFTPRITGMFSVLASGRFSTMLCIACKSLFGDECDHTLYFYRAIAPGLGFGLTTYAGDGDPLPSFHGEPLLLPLSGNIEQVAWNYWSVLNEVNRVALAVKFINLASRKSQVYTINRFDKV